MSEQKKLCPGRGMKKRGPYPRIRSNPTPAMTSPIDERALLRHGWYRRRLARLEATGQQP